MIRRKKNSSVIYPKKSVKKLKFRAITHKILYGANKGMVRNEFANELVRLILEFFKCDVVELILKEENRRFRFVQYKGMQGQTQFEAITCLDETTNKKSVEYFDSDEISQVLDIISKSEPEVSLPLFIKIINADSSRNANSVKPQYPDDKRLKKKVGTINIDENFKSTVILPFSFGPENIGILQMKCRKANFFKETDIEFYTSLTETLGIAFAHKRIQMALRERVKELSCVYEITKIIIGPEISLEEFFQKTLALTTRAMLYPEISVGRATFDGKIFQTSNFVEAPHKLLADITIKGKKRGMIEICYLAEKPVQDIGPFLKEELSLIEAVGKEVSLIIERNLLEEDRLKLQNQLLHADRLALFGQLAAGIAHELNEPLNGILGFAQLVAKTAGVPAQAQEDTQKIIATSLHAREIVKKLLFFAKQMPLKKTDINLNDIVKESLYLLENKMAKHNIECIKNLAPQLPLIYADAVQINQVIVNLAVNAIQAMPSGGTLTLTTQASDDWVSLTVKDTGIGMTEEVKTKIFLPFFTTKDINEGTGLGLSVVHGIIEVHKGKIFIQSEPGKGSRFEIWLPQNNKKDV